MRRGLGILGMLLLALASTRPCWAWPDAPWHPLPEPPLAAAGTSPSSAASQQMLEPQFELVLEPNETLDLPPWDPPEFTLAPSAWGNEFLAELSVPIEIVPVPAGEPSADIAIPSTANGKDSNGAMANSNPFGVATFNSTTKPVHDAPRWWPLAWMPRTWEGRVELGANGSQGNSERFATRYGGKLRRTTLDNLTTIDLLYSDSYARGKQNENKALLDARSEWPWETSPWFCYLHGTGEYDAFTAYRGRVTTDTGLGYNYVWSPVSQFKVRAGGGFSQELDSPQEELVPEMTTGFSIEHRLTKRQKLVAAGDFYSDVRDYGDLRAKGTASWEVKIDPEARLSFRVGIINRYDSTPYGKHRNDLDYSTLVVWEF